MIVGESNLGTYYLYIRLSRHTHESWTFAGYYTDNLDNSVEYDGVYTKDELLSIFRQVMLLEDETGGLTFSWDITVFMINNINEPEEPDDEGYFSDEGEP